ncbi:MAG TPA: hypothetical protein VF546_06375 [Pyrinomonadaceae bacterium]|jgi:hypothetical protein
MTDEERQRQMDFILNTQAQFAAGLEQMRERQAQSERRLERVERFVKLAVRAGVRTRREVREQLTALVNSHIRLADAQAKLTAVVERHVADGHGGQA